MLDLQKDKPYMHSDAPRPAVEDQSPRQTTTPMTRTTIHPAPLLTDDGSDDEDDNPLPLAADDDSDNESDDDSRPDYQLGEPAEQDDYGPPHPNKIVLPDETRPIEELRDGARHTSSHKRTRPQSYINQSYSEGETTWEENGELVRGGMLRIHAPDVVKLSPSGNILDQQTPPTRTTMSDQSPTII